MAKSRDAEDKPAQPEEQPQQPFNHGLPVTPSMPYYCTWLVGACPEGTPNDQVGQSPFTRPPMCPPVGAGPEANIPTIMPPCPTMPPVCVPTFNPPCATAQPECYANAANAQAQTATIITCTGIPIVCGIAAQAGNVSVPPNCPTVAPMCIPAIPLQPPHQVGQTGWQTCTQPTHMLGCTGYQNCGQPPITTAAAQVTLSLPTACPTVAPMCIPTIPLQPPHQVGPTGWQTCGQPITTAAAQVTFTNPLICATIAPMSPPPVGPTGWYTCGVVTHTAATVCTQVGCGAQAQAVTATAATQCTHPGICYGPTAWLTCGVQPTHTAATVCTHYGCPAPAAVQAHTTAACSLIPTACVGGGCNQMQHTAATQCHITIGCLGGHTDWLTCTQPISAPPNCPTVQQCHPTWNCPPAAAAQPQGISAWLCSLAGPEVCIITALAGCMQAQAATTTVQHTYACQPATTIIPTTYTQLGCAATNAQAIGITRTAATECNAYTQQQYCTFTGPAPYVPTAQAVTFSAPPNCPTVQQCPPTWNCPPAAAAQAQGIGTALISALSPPVCAVVTVLNICGYPARVAGNVATAATQCHPSNSPACIGQTGWQTCGMHTAATVCTQVGCGAQAQAMLPTTTLTNPTVQTHCFICDASPAPGGQNTMATVCTQPPACNIGHTGWYTCGMPPLSSPPNCPSVRCVFTRFCHDTNIAAQAMSPIPTTTVNPTYTCPPLTIHPTTYTQITLQGCLPAIGAQAQALFTGTWCYTAVHACPVTVAQCGPQVVWGTLTTATHCTNSLSCISVAPACPTVQ